MLFKKKTDKRILESDVAANQIVENIEKDVTVYTMPKRFLGKKLDANKAKKTGAIILSLGFLFLVAAGVFIYWYVFKNKPNATVQNTPTAINTTSQNTNNDASQEPARSAATSSDFVVSNNIDQSSLISSTTEDLLSGSVATSSEYEIGDNQNIPNVPIVPATSTKKILTTAPDSDSDGLTDLEEVVIGTKPTEVDSDGDSYNDLAELKGLYNPAGEGKLLVNTKFEVYSDPTFGYTLYYPKAWTINNGAGDGATVFQIDDKQFIEITVVDNTKKQTIEDWYKEQFNTNLILPTQAVYKKEWSGIASEDGLRVYLSNPLGDKIYSLFYNIGDGTVLGHKNIFNLMIDSLK